MRALSDAERRVILEKLGGDEDSVMVVIFLDGTRRVRLCNPPNGRSSFIADKWRRSLCLDLPEFMGLKNCTLSGPDAVSLCRARHAV